MIKAAVYTRVSTDDQVHNFSLGFQQKECEAFAKRQGWKVDRIFREEGASAKTVSGRPKLLELIKYCQDKKNGIGKVIVYKYDRWSRNTSEGLGVMGVLSKIGVDVVSVTEPSENNAMGKMIRGILLAWAEFDNNIKSERTKDGMRAAFEMGYWPWQPPIGYQQKRISESKRMVLIKSYESSLTFLFEDASTGLYTKHELADRMNKRGFAKAHGSPANIKTIDKILKKKFYFGIMEAKTWSIEAQGRHRPITSKELWEKAYTATYKKRNYNIDQNINAEFPLRRFLICGGCMRPLTGSFSKGRGGKYPYYHCIHGDCPEPQRGARDTIHESFVSYLNQFKLGKTQSRLLKAVLLSELEKKIRQYKREDISIKKQLVELDDERRRTIKAEDKQLLSTEEAQKILEDIKAQEAVLNVELSENKIDQYETEAVIDFATHFLANIGKLWKELDLPRKRRVQNKIFPAGVWLKNGTLGTSQISQSFELIKAYASKDAPLVTPQGIEP